MTEMIVDIDESGPMTFQHFVSTVKGDISDAFLAANILFELAKGKHFATIVKENEKRGVTVWLVCYADDECIPYYDDDNFYAGMHKAATSFHRDLVYVKD